MVIICLGGRGGRSTLRALGGHRGGAGQRGQRPGEFQQVMSCLCLLLGPVHCEAGHWGNICRYRERVIIHFWVHHNPNQRIYLIIVDKQIH